MSNLLIVPVYLDALILDKLTPIVEAFADFSRLPYANNQGHDVNPDIPNLSEEILSQPFQNQNLYLQPGIHLHWAIPDALTSGVHSTDKPEFPAVPNRWLVTRYLPVGQNATKRDQWVVESDYLDTQAATDQHITYPCLPGVTGQPFCYLGRRLPLVEWLDEYQNNRRPTIYLDHLTAIGYGEPAFAAFYPNCRSIFGFWDPEITGIHNSMPSYEVVGWYANREQDYLAQWMTQNQQAPGGPLSALQQANQWDIPGSGQALPEQMICYARISFRETGSTGFKYTNQVNPVPVAIANTSTEALSAYLGKQLDKQNKAIIEDQLEALHLAPVLSRSSLDIGSKFLEARHTREFRPSRSGLIWTLRQESEPAAQPPGEANTDQEQATLEQRVEQFDYSHRTLRRRP